MKRWLRWLVVLLIAVAVVAGISIPTAVWLRERSMPKYLTATITRGRIETVVNSTGTIKPVRTVSVGAFTSGPIREVYVDFNSEITEKEQLLALIDDKLARANVDRDKAAVHTQEADLKRILAQLVGAQLDEERAKALKLKDERFISASEMDSFKYKTEALVAQKELAEASVRQAKAILKNSEDQLSYTKVLGPKEIDPDKGIKGKVIDRKVDPGQTVAASFQTPELFTIALEMDKHVYLFASVDEADIGMIRGGKKAQNVKFTVDAYPGELFDGTIHEIRLNSTTTQNVVTYPVVIDAPNVADDKNGDLKLKPGMTASVTFQIDAKEDVLRVPVSALRFTPLLAQVHPDDRHYLEALTSTTAAKRSANEKAEVAKGRQRRLVWVQEEQWLRAVPVTLGLIEHQYAELIEGDLREGQIVVTGLEGMLGPR